ncbi:DUF948 domain-containing protein [Nakamurella antarctica]|uniref:DUF948 domain-containing protein n=1 Tax=Nakamurella antarctica TaxID=1902245 RepID=A0A3G8ZVQ4_9ACTN|nr:DUF948 domain-containing protein [Nakamurella antarctica]AZI57751.1 DUF948 domain-containing protein [Nakamurella antarctica]
MTVAEIILAVAAAAFLVLVLFAVITLSKLGRTLDVARTTMESTQHDASPVIRKADTTLALLNTNLSNIAGVTGAARSVTTNVSGLVSVAAATLGGPVVKTAAFTYGVRKALAARGAAKSATNARSRSKGRNR